MSRTRKGTALPEDGADGGITAIGDARTAPLGYRLMALAHLYDNRLARDLRKKNPAMTVPRLQALQLINAYPGVSGAELARAMYVRPQSVTQMLAVMGTLGWIERAAVPGNGRAVENSITEQGRTQLRAAVRVLHKMEKRLAEAYSHDGREQEVLVDLLVMGRRAVGSVLR